MLEGCSGVSRLGALHALSSHSGAAQQDASICCLPLLASAAEGRPVLRWHLHTCCLCCLCCCRCLRGAGAPACVAGAGACAITLPTEGGDV
jgi:hypothetical protein